MFILIFQDLPINSRQQVALCTPDGGGKCVRGMARIYSTGVHMPVFQLFCYEEYNSNFRLVIIAGFVAGSHHAHTGGGSNYMCLHRDPEWGPKNMPGFQSYSLIYGAVYKIFSNDPFSKANVQSLGENKVPCAMCHVTSRPTKLMIPARVTCPDGWTKEYAGYLMSEYHQSKGRTTYVCVDNAPEAIDGDVSDKYCVLFHNTEAVCGSLPCPKYGDGWEVTCVVCTK
ncbi:hypothetical protein NP493_812g02001 [Ridgeia piscesae]|uniref:Short-chain collagen C4-like n=1 Tax=Ridgeia piscesae TaxID=27915 RepID=A0AAD9KMI0_RIDPI|nr:hypothetical protein NP493_812g02001 [Ridgeia piscesae]